MHIQHSNLLSCSKNRGISPEQLEGHTWHDQFAKEVYQRLQASLRAYNAVDFDHLISLTVELFDRFPSVLERYHEQFQYIMIDEYQDTNPLQYRLATQLSSKFHHLCVVGDDDQSIYGWRNAEIGNLLKMQEEYKDHQVINLEENYRSTSSILKASMFVIEQDIARHSKSIIMLWFML